MNQNASNPESESAILSQLTAYLDGELDPAEIQQVEDRLSVDDVYRSHLQKLQQTWDMLDILPTSSANRSFTQSTMKLVVEDAEKLGLQKRRSAWTWPIRILALILAPILASATTFLISQFMQDIPNQRLAEDLAIVKDLDVLNCDENISIEFLEKLAIEKSIFGIVAPSKISKRYIAFRQSVPDVESITLLQPFEKQIIRSNREKFNQLSDSDQFRLKGLNEQIENSANSDSIRAALYDYQFWLSEQSSLVAAEIRDLDDPVQKIRRIKTEVEEQFLPQFTKQLPPEDLNTVFLGLVYLVEQQRASIDSTFDELFDNMFDQTQIRLDAARPFVDNNNEIGGIISRLSVVLARSKASEDLRKPPRRAGPNTAR